MSVTVQRFLGRLRAGVVPFLLLTTMLAVPRVALAQVDQPGAAPVVRGGEASLVLPDLSSVSFQGVDGRTLLMGGIVVCAFGLLFGLLTFTQLKNLPVHRSML
jgi:K(+)-stimulated pyrophosphate-energized sodium pump